MKVIFLGTSHGVPMPGRHYQSILIETEKGGYLIDAGAPVMELLINRGYDLSRLKSVFVTHMHTDHSIGLVNTVILASWYYKMMAYDVYLPEELAIKEIKTACCSIFHGALTDRVVFHTVDEGLVFDDGNIRVTAVPNDHMLKYPRKSFSYLIEQGDERVYVTGDLGHPLTDFPAPEAYKGHVNAFICECAHFSAEKLLPKLATVKADAVMPIHVFPLDKYDTLAAHAGEIPAKLIFPNDGDEFTLPL